MFNDYELKSTIESQKKTIDELSEQRDYYIQYNSVLELKCKALDTRQAETFAFAGLSGDELQGIHGLIQKHISLLSELQEKVKSPSDVYELNTGVESLATLASLVSKPTD
tara:strand:- start:1075 stop:1404 length:330 start_codon:yes stop_codon:yes gene_type:complete